MHAMITHPLVLFDGVCALCNGAVNFLIDHDPEARLRFGALQHFVEASNLHDPAERGGDSPLRGVDIPSDTMKTIIFVEPGANPDAPPRVSTRSDAVLRLASYLPRPWRWARFLWFVPRPIRDAIYTIVANNRYRWFGKRDTCRVPTPDSAERFIDW